MIRRAVMTRRVAVPTVRGMEIGLHELAIAFLAAAVFLVLMFGLHGTR